MLTHPSPVPNREPTQVLTARAVGGEPTRSEESSEVRWVPRAELGGYSMDRSMRLRIGHYLEGRAAPYLG